MGIIDLHNHTKYSYDGQNSAREVILNAISNGVQVVGITDHQFSIGNNIEQYIDEINALKKEFSGKIKVLCGLEIGLRPKPCDFAVSLSQKLDYCLFESSDSQAGMDLFEFLEWKRLFSCPVGLAHTDIFYLAEKYRLDIFKLLKRENIFWEINFSGNYNYYFDLITNHIKQNAVSESGITLSIGSDSHWIGDYSKKRLLQTKELADRLGNPIIFDVR